MTDTEKPQTRDELIRAEAEKVYFNRDPMAALIHMAKWADANPSYPHLRSITTSSDMFAFNFVADLQDKLAVAQQRAEKLAAAIHEAMGCYCGKSTCSCCHETADILNNALAEYRGEK